MKVPKVSRAEYQGNLTIICKALVYKISVEDNVKPGFREQSKFSPWRLQKSTNFCGSTMDRSGTRGNFKLCLHR